MKYASVASEFTPLRPQVNAGDAELLEITAGVGAALAAHALTDTTAPKNATQMAIGSRKKIQTMKNQWNVPPIHQDLPTTLTVMSR